MLVVKWLVWILRLFQRSVQPGDLIALRRSGADGKTGTLGCVVTIGGTRYALTCDHALPSAAHGDRVAHYRPPMVTGPAGTSTAGKFARVIGEFYNLPTLASVDCALVRVWFHARVKSKHPEPIGWVDPEVYPTDKLVIRPRTQLDGRIPVQFCGGVTKPVSKGAASLGAWAPLLYGSGGQVLGVAPPFIEIKSEMDPALDVCDDGDSGSLVVTAFDAERPRPIGVLVAQKPDAIAAFGLAVPFQRVLDAIGQRARLDAR